MLRPYHCAAAIMEGRSAACIAYGQTGSGKTYQVGRAVSSVIYCLLYLILQPDWEWLQATPQCSYLSQELTGQPMQCCTAACHVGCMLLAPRAPKLSLHWFAAMRQQT